MGAVVALLAGCASVPAGAANWSATATPRGLHPCRDPKFTCLHVEVVNTGRRILRIPVFDDSDVPEVHGHYFEFEERAAGSTGEWAPIRTSLGDFDWNGDFAEIPPGNRSMLAVDAFDLDKGDIPSGDVRITLHAASPLTISSGPIDVQGHARVGR